MEITRRLRLGVFLNILLWSLTVYLRYGGMMGVVAFRMLLGGRKVDVAYPWQL